jgi:hypothetical protein
MLHGAELLVFNAAGLTSDSVAVPLSSGWSAVGNASSPKGWRYRSTDLSSPVRSVLVEADKIVVKAGAASFGYTVDEPMQGSVGVRLLLGQIAWCATAPAKATGIRPRRPATTPSTGSSRSQRRRRLPAVRRCRSEGTTRRLRKAWHAARCWACEPHLHDLRRSAVRKVGFGRTSGRGGYPASHPQGHQGFRGTSLHGAGIVFWRGSGFSCTCVTRG